MRITFILQWADEMGGTERSVFSQANYLACHHEVEILSVFRTRSEPFFSVEARVNMRYLVDCTSSVSRPLRLTSYSDETCRVLAATPSRLVLNPEATAFNGMTDIEMEFALQNIDSDVVVTTSDVLAAHVANLLTLDVVRVHQEHLIPEQGGGKEEFLSYASGVDAIVVPSERTKDWMVETFGRNAPRVEVIPNALPDGSQHKSTLDSPVIVAAGRLAPIKQFDHAIRAFSVLVEEHPDWTLRIFGEGPLKRDTLSLIEDLNLKSHVQLMAATPQMNAEWADASIALHSARMEPFGLVLIEAFSAGVPVVAYDCPNGPAEIITHNVDGLLVPPNDVAGLTAALRKLIEEDEVRRTFGDAAFRSSERYRIDRIMPRWEALYSELSARRKI